MTKPIDKAAKAAASAIIDNINDRRDLKIRDCDPEIVAEIHEQLTEIVATYGRAQRREQMGEDCAVVLDNAGKCISDASCEALVAEIREAFRKENT